MQEITIAANLGSSFKYTNICKGDLNNILRLSNFVNKIKKVKPIVIYRSSCTQYDDQCIRKLRIFVVVFFDKKHKAIRYCCVNDNIRDRTYDVILIFLQHKITYNYKKLNNKYNLREHMNIAIYIHLLHEIYIKQLLLQYRPKSLLLTYPLFILSKKRTESFSELLRGKLRIPLLLLQFRSCQNKYQIQKL